MSVRIGLTLDCGDGLIHGEAQRIWRMTRPIREDGP